jgi:hypothetical protein
MSAGAGSESAMTMVLLGGAAWIRAQAGRMGLNGSRLGFDIRRIGGMDLEVKV